MSDMEWLREQVTKRKLRDCTDSCLQSYLERFGDRRIAFEAIDSVWHGQPYQAPALEGAQ